MRCKPGDLAVRVFARPDSRIRVGAIVRVVGKSKAATYGGRNSLYSARGAKLWDVEYQGTLFNSETGNLWGIPDHELRPLRPSTKQDETLTWKPIHEPA